MCVAIGSLMRRQHSKSPISGFYAMCELKECALCPAFNLHNMCEEKDEPIMRTSSTCMQDHTKKERGERRVNVKVKKCCCTADRVGRVSKDDVMYKAVRHRDCIHAYGSCNSTEFQTTGLVQ